MVRAHYTASADCAADALWRQLSDLESWPRWLRAPYASESVTIMSAPPTGAGTEFVLRGRLPYRLFARITDWEETRLLGFEIYRSEYPSDRLFFGRAILRIELEPVDPGRTIVRCSHVLEGRGLAGRLYAWLVMRPFLSTNVRRIVSGLKWRA